MRTIISNKFLSPTLDGEWEAQWLISAGFPQLTRAFEQVRWKFNNFYLFMQKIE
jgi:hypothetical protein